MKYFVNTIQVHFVIVKTESVSSCFVHSILELDINNWIFLTKKVCWKYISDDNTQTPGDQDSKL